MFGINESLSPAEKVKALQDEIALVEALEEYNEDTVTKLGNKFSQLQAMRDALAAAQKRAAAPEDEEFSASNNASPLAAPSTERNAASSTETNVAPSEDSETSSFPFTSGLYDFAGRMFSAAGHMWGTVGVYTSYPQDALGTWTSSFEYATPSDDMPLTLGQRSKNLTKSALSGTCNYVVRPISWLVGRVAQVVGTAVGIVGAGVLGLLSAVATLPSAFVEGGVSGLKSAGQGISSLGEYLASRLRAPSSDMSERPASATMDASKQHAPSSPGIELDKTAQPTLFRSVLTAVTVGVSSVAARFKSSN